MIAEGRIALNGSVLETPATLLTSLHGVTVDGEPVQEAAPARLFLFHKPAGVLTAAFDPAGRPTIYDRLPGDLPRLIPVGRLDLNTEGLLLLTTDGELKRQLELPATGVERAYRARAYGDVTQAQLEELIDGVEVEGVRYGSIDANLERRTGANVWVEMVLTEGKNREVRRVLEYLGLQVSRLIRTRYGPFILGDLPVGEIGEVRQVDLIQFRASLRGNKAKALEEARANPVAVRAPEKRASPASQAAASGTSDGAADRARTATRAASARAGHRTDGSRGAALTGRPDRARGRHAGADIAEDARPPRRTSADRAGTGQSQARTPAEDRSANHGRDDRPRRVAPDRDDRSQRRSPADQSDAKPRRAGATGADRAAGARSGRGVAREDSRPPRQAYADRAERPAATPARKMPEREELSTRPRRALAGPVTECSDAKPKPKPVRGAGWAKAKPKARPGKPRKPRA